MQSKARASLMTIICQKMKEMQKSCDKKGMIKTWDFTIFVD